MTIRATKQNVLDHLELTSHFGGDIIFCGEQIGAWLTHGSAKNKTVYASRIYRPCKIEIKAGRKDTLTNRIASDLNRAIKDGHWPYPDAWKNEYIADVYQVDPDGQRTLVEQDYRIKALTEYEAKILIHEATWTGLQNTQGMTADIVITSTIETMLAEIEE